LTIIETYGGFKSKSLVRYNCYHKKLSLTEKMVLNIWWKQWYLCIKFHPGSQSPNSSVQSMTYLAIQIKNKLSLVENINKTSDIWTDTISTKS